MPLIFLLLGFDKEKSVGKGCVSLTTSEGLVDLSWAIDEGEANGKKIDLFIICQVKCDLAKKKKISLLTVFLGIIKNIC